MAGAIAVLGLWAAGCAGQSGNPAPKVDASPYLAELQRLPVLGGGGSTAASSRARWWWRSSWPPGASLHRDRPRLQQIYDQDQARGLVAIAVGMDLEGPQVLRPFADQLGLRYPVLVADDALRNGQTAFGKVGLLPTTLIIGRDGRVVSIYAGVAEQGTLEPLIDEALRKSAPR